MRVWSAYCAVLSFGDPAGVSVLVLCRECILLLTKLSTKHNVVYFTLMTALPHTTQDPRAGGGEYGQLFERV